MSWPEAIFGAIAVVSVMAFFIVLAKQPAAPPPKRPKAPPMPLWTTTYTRKPKDEEEVKS